MVTLEQKLSEFQKIIEEKVDNENKLLIEAKKAEIEEYLAKAEKELSEQYERNRRLGLERIEKQKQEKISALMQGQRRDQLKLMEDFLQKITTNIEERFRDFVLSEEYPQYAARLLALTLQKSSIETQDQIIIKIPPQNFDRSREKMQEYLKAHGYDKAEILEGDIDYVGGFIIELPEKNMRINKTISMSIEEKRDNIGQYIQSYIQGGAN